MNKLVQIAVFAFGLLMLGCVGLALGLSWEVPFASHETWEG